MTRETEGRDRSLLQVRVTVADSEPSIWRLLEVDSSLTLGSFHQVIQAAVGWQDTHLHYFSDTDPNIPPSALKGTRREPRRWVPEAIVEDHEDALPESEWVLGDVLTAGNRHLFYEYDFGDGWTHRLELTGSRPALAGDPVARLVEGSRRAPLEDSGGIHGYQDLLTALADPGRGDHHEAKEWVAGVIGPWNGFDPEEPGLDAGNDALRHLFAEELFVGPEASAIQGLAHRVLPGARREFLAYVASAGVDQPALVDPDTAEAMTAAYLWLIRRIGNDGVSLTSAGWLPPSLVQSAMTDLGWDRSWIGKANREVQTVPVLKLRESAQELGLIRKFKGRLVLTAAGKRLLDDPVGLWLFLARSLPHRHRHEAELDAALLLLLEVAAGKRTAWSDVVDAVSFGLSMLGWATSAGTRLPRTSVQELLRGPRQILLNLGFFGGYVGLPATDTTPQERAFARAALQA